MRAYRSRRLLVLNGCHRRTPRLEAGRQRDEILLLTAGMISLSRNGIIVRSGGRLLVCHGLNTGPRGIGLTIFWLYVGLTRKLRRKLGRIRGVRLDRPDQMIFEIQVRIPCLLNSRVGSS